MTTLGLPLSVLRFFEPRPPQPYLKPPTKPSWERKKLKINGVARFLSEFDDPKDDPPVEPIIDKEERQKMKVEAKAKKAKETLEAEIPLYKPLDTLKDNPDSTEDPMKTLFVGRLSFNVTEDQLRREFDEFGPIRKVTLVNCKRTGKPRGYAFIEFEREKDLRVAFMRGDCRKIDGRRVVADVERGRTVPGWLPRRLGGGKGGTRKGGKKDCITLAGRERSPVRGGAPASGRDSRDGREGPGVGYADLDRPRGLAPPRGRDDDRRRDSYNSRGDDRRDDRDRYGGRGGYDRDRDRDRGRDRDRRDSRDGPSRRDSYGGRDRDRGDRDRDRDRGNGGGGGSSMSYGPPAGGRSRDMGRSRGGLGYGAEVPPPDTNSAPRNYR